MGSDSQNNQFYKSDLDPMTLILKLDLDIVKMYHHTKNEVSLSRHSKVKARTDRHTDRHIDSMKTLLPANADGNKRKVMP